MPFRLNAESPRAFIITQGLSLEPEELRDIFLDTIGAVAAAIIATISNTTIISIKENASLIFFTDHPRFLVFCYICDLYNNSIFDSGCEVLRT